jgi:hypothetical protein
VNGCWEIWPEAVDDFCGFYNQQDEIRSYSLLADKVPGKDS